MATKKLKELIMNSKILKEPIVYDCLQAKIAENLGKSLMLVTALVPEIGYEKSAEIAKKALKENISLKESALKLKYLSEKEFDKIVKPKSMVSPKKV